MKSRRWLLPLALIGLLTMAAHSQLDGATYIGTKTCSLCHKGRNAKLVESYPTTAHARAMQEASDKSIVGDFTKDAPFEKAQVAFVLGLGRSQQAYLDKDLKVLPGLWLVGDKKWVKQDAVDGATECVGCHTTGFDPATKKWDGLGVGCERCHGAGSKHKTAKREDRKSTIVRPQELDPKLQAMDCGQCHSRGRSKDNKLAYPAHYTPGTDLTEVFTDSKPETMGRNQQFSDLQRSPKHWAKGVVCEKCHDPHGGTGNEHQLRMPINETCTQCHEDKKDIAAHAKAKNKTLADKATCATCHMPQGRHLFDKTLADK